MQLLQKSKYIRLRLIIQEGIPTRKSDFPPNIVDVSSEGARLQ